MAIERLQKILAKAGIASRRKAEDLIQLGEITINGKVARLGDKADSEKDAIKVSGKLLRFSQTHVYYAFHKPRGVISMITPDNEGRPTISYFLDNAKIKGRLFPVGRLDFNGEGLVFLTNDGDLAERIQKSADIVRVYHVKIKGHPTEAILQKLTKGAQLGGGVLRAHSAELVQVLKSKAWVRVSFVGMGMLGIKELFQTLGFLVERVVRVQIGQIELKSLPPGGLAMLKKPQLEAVVDMPELGLEILKKKPKIEIRLTEEDDERETGEYLTTHDDAGTPKVEDWGSGKSGKEKASDSGWGRVSKAKPNPKAKTAAKPGRKPVVRTVKPGRPGTKKSTKPGAKKSKRPASKSRGKTQGGKRASR